VRPFADVRASIEADLRRQGAQKAYAETAEAFTNFVYEQPDSLEAAAKKFQLPLQHVDGVTRQGPLPPAVAAWFPPQVIEALFSPDSIGKHRNTKAIEAGANTLVSARVVQYSPAAARPLAEVRAQILARLQQEEAVKLAQKEGRERLAALEKQASDAGFEPVREIARRDSQLLPAAALNEVFGLAVGKLPGYVGVDIPGGGYAIVRVLSASQVPVPEGADAGLEKALAERAAAADSQSLHAALRERLGAKVTAKKPPPAAAG
jgi:peptidyl-prolyl cis-trans isomerase D